MKRKGSHPEAGAEIGAGGCAVAGQLLPAPWARCPWPDAARRAGAKCPSPTALTISEKNHRVKRLVYRWSQPSLSCLRHTTRAGGLTSERALSAVRVRCVSTRTTPRRPRATRRRPEDVRRLLLAAAERVVSQHGSERATVTAIAEEAGVSLASLYRHFESREDILQQAIQAPLAQFMEQWRATLPQTHPISDDAERLRLYIKTIYDAGLQHKGLLQTLLVELPGGGEHLTASIMPMLRDVLDQLEEIGRDQAREQGIDQDVIVGGVRLVTLLTLLTTVLGPAAAHTDNADDLITFLARFCAHGIRQTPTVPARARRPPPASRKKH